MFFNKLVKSAHKKESFDFHAPNRGGILIEFAFSVPVLIILMFFVIDHYRFYELRSKIKTSTYLAASMLQQIGNTRSNKQLTIRDIQRITFASCLNFFHTNTMFEPSPFGLRYIAHFYYVKRQADGQYLYQKTYADTGRGTSPETMIKSGVATSILSADDVRKLHPDLICDAENDERVVIDCCYRIWHYSDKRQLGFFALNPRYVKSLDNAADNIMVFNLALTPKPGLFPVTN